jgi:single-strand DNA-binding protein
MLNVIILQGRLTGDPELKATQNGKSVTSFSLAVDRDFSTSGEKETDFINIVAWNKTAEFISQYFTKGKQMLVKGSLSVRKYQTQNGENRYATEVIADKVYFCGDKGKDPLVELQGKIDGFAQNESDFEEIAGEEILPF